MKKILYFASAVLALVAVSCSKYEVTDAGHTPGEPDVEGCYKVYFPTQEASGSHTYDPTQAPEIEIMVVRENAKGAITVPYDMYVSKDSIFVKGDIKFANGQDTTALVISFPNAKTDGTTYSFSLKISDPQYASHYSSYVTDFDFSVMRVEYKKFDTGTLTTCAPLEVTDVKECEMWYYEVGDIRYCKIVDGLKIGDFTADYMFNWNTKTNTLYIPMQKTGYLFEGIHMYLSDGIAFYNGYYGEDYWSGSTSYASWEDYCAKNGIVIAKYDGNGGFYLADWFYYDITSSKSGYGAQFGGSSVKDCDSFICKSFTRTDFEIKGITSDYPSQGVQPVFITAGRDVKKIKYACVAGELSATQAEKLAQAIQDKTASDVKESSDYVYDSEEDVNYYSLGLSFSETGKYTIVSISNPTDTTFNFGYASFAYVSKDDAEKYEVDITVAAEDIHPRYGFTKVEAFSYYILGKDVTEVHVGLFDTETYEKNKTAINAVVKTLSDTTVAFKISDEILAQINSLGGFASYANGLSPLTSYTFVVWATNGAQDVLKTAEYTTDGLPLELLKQGTYNTAILFNKSTDSVNLFFDPNTKDEYVLNDMGFGSLRFSWDTETNKITKIEPQRPGYSHASYGTLYVGEVLEMMKFLYPTNYESAIAYYENQGMKIKSLAGTSNYNPENNTISFAVCWYLTAGYIDTGIDTFVITPTTGGTVSLSAVSSEKSQINWCKALNTGNNLKSLSSQYSIKCVPSSKGGPRVSFKRIERNPSSVEFSSQTLPFVKKTIQQEEKAGIHKFQTILK